MRRMLQSDVSLVVQGPQPGSQINNDGPLNVVGLAIGKVGADLVVPDSVTVQLGNQAPVDAILKPLHPSSVPTSLFKANLQVVVPSGPITITVRAFFDNIEQRSVSVPVIASGPGDPLFSTFTANATLLTTNSNAQRFDDTLMIGTMFSGDRETIVITDFPPISKTSDILPGVTDTVTVSLIGPALGKLIPSNLPRRNVAMTVAVNLLFHHDVNVGQSPGDSTLSLFMTTGSEQSPSGAFHDTGTTMDSDGNIKLIGDGRFVGGFFGDPPTDASLVLAGSFSPAPFPPLVNI